MINPIVMNNQYNDLLSKIRGGTLDARGEVLRLLGGLNNAQKTRLKRLLPLVGNIARANNIDAQALNEISAHL